MKKVGIITLYYNNNNYGGIAQAYALTEFLNEIGYEAELVSYKRSPQNTMTFVTKDEKSKKIINLLEHFDGFGKRIRRKFVEEPLERILDKKYRDRLNLRLQAFENSRDKMAHSKIYTEQTIEECSDKYDIFITGSDQVWKPGVIQGAYVWDFLSAEKKCISYAASITTETYPEWYTSYMKKQLKKYDWISVREMSAKLYLEKILDREIIQVVDPTFLLKEEKWEKIASKRLVEGKYIFAYMLGNSYKQRRTIKKIAKKMNLPVVVLPHLENKVRLCDCNFGDTCLYDIGLAEFLSLIKHADLVCTDSFHAVVFSNIFATDFWVFEREVILKKDRMGSRIETLLQMLEEQDRKISDKQHFSKSKLNQKIDFARAKSNLNTSVETSKRKFQQALEYGEN